MKFVHVAMTRRGFDVFWDLEVPAGIDWDYWIKARLDQSRCVIVFWTKNSVASPNVRQEVTIAREQGKLLQVLLEPLATRDLPMGVFAEQSVKLMEWRGDETDSEWVKLISAIEEKATSSWMRQKVSTLEVLLKAEHQRFEEADAKARSLEDAHAREVSGQGDLRRQRDIFKEDRDRLTETNARLQQDMVKLKAECQRFEEADAKARSLEDAHAREVSEQGDLRRQRDIFKEDRDRLTETNARLKQDIVKLKAECSRFMKERDSFVAERDALLKKKSLKDKLGIYRPKINWKSLLFRLSTLFSIVAYVLPLMQVVLINWNIIAHRFEFIELVIAPAIIACCVCFTVALGISPFIEWSEKLAEALIIFLPLGIAWAILTYVPFESWWRLVYLIPILAVTRQLSFLYTATIDRSSFAASSPFSRWG